MSGFTLLVLLSGTFMRVGTVGSHAPEPYSEAPVIRFANGLRIDTRIAPFPRAGTQLETGTACLVHVSGPVRQQWLAALRRIGADPVCYLAFQTIVCRPWRDITVGDLRGLEFVDWLGRLPDAAKLAPELVALSLENRDSLRFAGPSPLAPNPILILSVWPGEDPYSIAATIASAGGEVIKVMNSTVRFRLAAARVAGLAALSPVAWIQECAPARRFNYDVQWVMQIGWRPERPDSATGHPIWAHGIEGQNMVVGLFDTGINMQHDMFVDPNVPLTAPGLYPNHRKVVAYKLYEGAKFGDAGEYHGTTVAATLCGNDSIVGNASKLDGVAPDCRLYFVDEGDGLGFDVFDDDFTALLDSVRLSNGVNPPVRQVSGSFGNTESLSYYRLEESSVDEVCWKDKQFLVIWAAANERGPDYNIGHPAAAKSVLTVGACGNGTDSDSVWFKSSRGPCRDGRIKPDILAPGVNVNTADGRNLHSYVTVSGTSISAPAASGALMLLRQYFAEGRYPDGTTDPTRGLSQISSALMRAMAIAATDSNVGQELIPNKAAGWGRLDVSTIMHFSDNSNGLAFVDHTAGVATGEDVTFQFELSGREPIHVVLAWTDTAALPAAAIAIVNDLDLELTSPDGNHYRGNQFYNGWSWVNPQGWDDRNTEEVCLVPHPLAGRWTARVIGRNVFTSRQPFAVAVRGGIAGMVPGIAESQVDRRRMGTPIGTQFGPALRPGWDLAVFAIDGRTVFAGTVPKSGLSPVPALPPGVYLYRLRSGSMEPVAGKIVVCR